QRDLINKLQADIEAKNSKAEVVQRKPELFVGGNVQVTPKHLVCPLCEGEGRYMVRRVIRGTITDVSNTCPLCMGIGKRIISMPQTARICSDCGGFGKRLLIVGAVKHGSTGKELRTFDQIRTKKFGELPQTTACSRCLSRGFILRPGLETN
ncbi:MAG TPA: hypothetical protein VIU12_07155, partial [Chryseolinea sp.]